VEKQTILFVDDELDMRIFLSTVLKSAGYAAVSARNAREGLERARERAPDLVIMDVMMPPAGGVAMFHALKADKDLRHIPVIMLTGVNPKAFAHHLKMVNVSTGEALPPPDAYLEKPLDPEMLLSTIRKLLP
jgi:CheY-like chemotaxis protein